MRFACLVSVLCLAACGGRGGGSIPHDGGGGVDAAGDGAVGDAGAMDGGAMDGGSDSGGADGGGTDAGGTDAGHADAGGMDAGHDAGPTDAGPRDLGFDATTTATTVSFPSSTDTVHTMLTNYWNAGDYVEGARSTTLLSITQATLDVGIAPNTLSGDTQDMEMLINGTVVGTFHVAMGDTRRTDAFTFPAISGPTYTLRFETTRTVSSGAGSAGFDTTTSTVTLAP